MKLINKLICFFVLTFEQISIISLMILDMTCFLPLQWRDFIFSILILSNLNFIFDGGLSFRLHFSLIHARCLKDFSVAT